MNYTTAEVASALGTTPKTVDNMLAREAKHLIVSGSRGKARQIDERSVEILAVALLLRRDLETSARRAVRLATDIVASPASDVAVGTLGAIQFDIITLRRVLRQALADALEDSRPVRRGRPRRKAKRGASL